jgi:hypothetical protein
MTVLDAYAIIAYLRAGLSRRFTRAVTQAGGSGGRRARCRRGVTVAVVRTAAAPGRMACFALVDAGTIMGVVRLAGAAGGGR